MRIEFAVPPVPPLAGLVPVGTLHSQSAPPRPLLWDSLNGQLVEPGGAPLDQDKARAELLKAWRKAAKLSQAQAGKWLGVGAHQVSRWETANPPMPETPARLLAHLALTPVP